MDLFTYGTLQVDEVWRRVAGEQRPTVPGVVHGHAVYRVDDREYPGMTPESGATTPGLVYLDVTPAMLARLDAFEGDEYVRQPVTVACQDGAQRECQAYLVPAEERGILTDEPWDLETFLTTGALDRFLGRYPGFG